MPRHVNLAACPWAQGTGKSLANRLRCFAFLEATASPRVSCAFKLMTVSWTFFGHGNFASSSRLPKCETGAVPVEKFYLSPVARAKRKQRAAERRRSHAALHELAPRSDFENPLARDEGKCQENLRSTSSRHLFKRPRNRS